ncbi:histone-lysine N-methyltransferase, H3 lysine-9 specific SUVH4 [Medicago truncatula]|uniref:histone-lysine N-methyltransferase, H3 lysine-9 specific SUVH4 n=1 Tax=Medicago truncatula TaxID=3880 RepID=UPI000D2F251D|nr:histone-lysine N-methyltransferase, H3 lysine-9 specific SUVH4 [Medicago truncatula]
MEVTKSCENEAMMMVPTRASSRLQNLSKIQYNIYNSSGDKVFGQHVEKTELESSKESLATITKVRSQHQNRNKIPDDISHKRGMVSFEDNAEKTELGSKEESLVSTTKVCSQLQNRNEIPDDISHKRGMVSLEDNVVEKRTKINSLRRKPCSRSRSTSNDSLVFDGLDFRGILSLRETSRLANLRCLAKVEKNGIDNEYVPGITTSKYLINKLRELAKVGTYKVHLMEGQVSKALSSSPSLVCKDISNGQEAISIIATNDFDDPPVAPTGFEYITSNKVSPSIEVPSNAAGCNCKGSCRTKRCSCANHNGSEFSYNNIGRLIEPLDIVVECGPQCGCGPKCGNKISQQGLSYRLEVYRTAKKGWAVRTWDFIPSGAPVVEYIGVLSRDDELGSANGNDYIFDIDCLHTINSVDGRERRLGNVPLPINNLSEKKDELMEKDPEYCIDAGSFGNVSRFINHGCEPNLFVQCVLSCHRDPRLARVVLFAAEDIPPYQELTYDYGYTLDSVSGSDGKIKQLQCHCGAKECRKRLY